MLMTDLLEHYADNRILQGLEYVQDILTCTDVPRLTDLIIHDLCIYQSTADLGPFPRALKAKDEHFQEDQWHSWESTDGTDPWDDGDDATGGGSYMKFTFGGDQALQRPNLAWSKLARKMVKLPYNADEFYFHESSEGLRELGYIFWDESRFQNWNP
jgi:hypothetical protein